MDFGKLHLPLYPDDAAPLCWADVTVNRILVVAAVLLALLALRDYLKLLPLLRGSLVRSRGNIEIEHSVSQARNRNRCASVALFIFVLMADRYSLYPAPFLEKLPQELRVAATLGVLSAFILLRFLIFRAIRLSRTDSESRSAVHSALYNYFLAFLPLMLATLALLWAFKTPDSFLRWALWLETAAFLGLALLRESQILAGKYSPLQTFLYLCALELIPLACLTIPAALR